jgi:hypothetical protein
MPKIRSGKIMQRVIAGISNFADVGDTTTLANLEIVDGIRHHVQSEKATCGEVPRELYRAGDRGDQGIRSSRLALDERLEQVEVPHQVPVAEEPVTDPFLRPDPSRR